MASLKNVRDVIEGGRAMLGGDYMKWLGDAPDESASDAEERVVPESPPFQNQSGWGTQEQEEVEEGTNFSFGWADPEAPAEAAPADFSSEDEPAEGGRHDRTQQRVDVRRVCDRAGR